MLKWLAIALLLVNVVLFGWLYDQHIDAALRASGAAAPIAPGTPALVLVGELDRLPEARDASTDRYDSVVDGGLTEEEVNFEFDDDGGSADAVVPAAPGMAPAAAPAAAVDLESDAGAAPVRELIPGTASSLGSGRCYRAGPYLTREAYQELLEWLRERTVSVAVTSDKERTRQLYWVYLEALDAETAAASIEDFQAQGIEDFYLIRRGGLNNDAISLGLFSSQDAVNRRLAELNEKGYQPVVVPRWETRDNFYLAAELAAGYEDLDDLPLELAAVAPVEEAECGGDGTP